MTPVEWFYLIAIFALVGGILALIAGWVLLAIGLGLTLLIIGAFLPEGS